MTNTPEFSFHHGGVSVPNLEEAINWYREILGFEVEKRFEIPPANANVAMVRKGNMRFEIFEVKDSTPLAEARKLPDTDVQTQGNLHVAFRIESLDDFLAYAEEKGADVAFIVRQKFGYGCFLRDCAGNLIEFVEEPQSE